MFNSEGVTPTDSVKRSIFHKWICAFVARGSVKTNVAILEFKFENTIDLLSDKREDLLNLLYNDPNKESLGIKTYSKYKYRIEKDKSDQKFWDVFNLWKYDKPYIPSCLAIKNITEDGYDIDSFLSTYILLRGRSHMKNISGKEILVSTIYGNRTMLSEFRNMLYYYMFVKQSTSKEGYMPKIKSNDNKDLYIELGPSIMKILNLG